MKILMENNNYFMYAGYDWVDGARMYSPNYSQAPELAKDMREIDAKYWFNLFKDREFIHRGKTYTRRCIALELIG